MLRHYVYCREVPGDIFSAIHDERRRTPPPPVEQRRKSRYNFYT